MKKFASKSLYFLLTLAIIAASFSPTVQTEKAYATSHTVELRGATPPTGSTVTPATGAVTGTPSQGKSATDQAPPKDKPDFAGCVYWFGINIDACLANIVYMIMWIFSWVLWIAGKILDMSLYYTLHMSDLLTHVPVVDIGWKIFRDIANICFIFVLLWTAIGTILGVNSGKTKELLAPIVVVALLINFSLFITKAVVDASNIVALHFYELIT